MNALLTQGRRCVNALLQGLLALLGRGWRPQAAGPVTRIVVIELTRLGDVCAAASLFRPLRQAYPQATLEAVVQAPYAPLLETELNKVHGIAGRGWGFLRAAWHLGPRLRGPGLLVVSASPAIRHSVLVWLSHPGQAVGFLFPPRPSLRYDTPGQVSARGMAADREEPWPGQGHMQERCQAVLRAAGLPTDLPMPFLRPDVYRPKGTRSVVLHAGANWAWRRWPLQRFAGLAGRLQARGCQVTLIPAEGGPLDEAPAGVQVADGLSLAQLRDLLGRAALFVGNDSGPMHLAAALGTPCLALFGPNLEERSGPWPLPSTPGSPNRTLRVPVPCSPCAQNACLQPGDWCMEKLGLDAVEAQALTMLNATQ